MSFDSTLLRTSFDWKFRPATYFLPDAPPPPEPLFDEVRDAIGRIHPSLMGGLYLPDFLPGEVEIVRVTLESVTADVLSVRARPLGNRIAYRVVDEYETVYRAHPPTSTKPLTFEGIVRLMDTAEPKSDADAGIVLGAVKYNAMGGSDLDQLRAFATVTSKFYLELGRWYARYVGAWLDEQIAELRAGGKEEDHEGAR